MLQMFLVVFWLICTDWEKFVTAYDYKPAIFRTEERNPQALKTAVPPMATGGRLKNGANAYGYALVKDYIVGL